MYKIGIFGHGPDRFNDHEKTQRLMGYTIDLLNYQYGSDTIFCVEAATGIGLWGAQECVDKGSKFHLYLPYPVEQTHQHWYDSQKDMLRDFYALSSSITICNGSLSGKSEPYRGIVDQSNFVIFFWVGSKQGKTADAIRYALNNNVLAINACDDLKLITKNDLNKKRAIWRNKKTKYRK